MPAKGAKKKRGGGSSLWALAAVSALAATAALASLRLQLSSQHAADETAEPIRPRRRKKASHKRGSGNEAKEAPQPPVALPLLEETKPEAKQLPEDAPATARELEPAESPAEVTSAAPPVLEPEAPSKEEPTWIYCAGQWQECICGGRVKWGNVGKWQIIEMPKDKSIQKVVCSIDKLGDLIPGDGGKHCQCEVTPGTSFYRRLNPMLMPEDLADSTGSRLIGSCQIFEQGRSAGPHSLAQWQATEPFCSADWEARAGSDPALKTGNKKIELGVLQGLMRVRIDERFVKNYERLVDKDGWIERAFVNYYAGAPDGKHTKMSEELVRSVHLFSKEPIIVFHLGSLTPDDWTASRFPRLLLMHLSPLGPAVPRSFNFNKIRTFLLARVRVGVELDSDQFVAPGVDYMFNMTQREVTSEYPIPILPVHYFSFTQRDAPSNIWWRRFCTDPPKCQRHSMRWSHAHPTWTFWALPWIGKWLRRILRDETLPEAPHMGALRVADIPEDEDMLNVAAWEDKVTKQWCKFDNDRTEFEEMIRWEPGNANKCPSGTGCSNIMADARFYPKGAAKAHFTAHNAKDPVETKRWIDRIHERYKKGLYPPKIIIYQGKFFANGEELREKHPELPCLL